MNIVRTIFIICLILILTASAAAQSGTFITLTDVHGHPVTINLEHLQTLRIYEPEELIGRPALVGKTQIVTTKGVMAVLETPEEILRKIGECRCGIKVPKP